MLSRELRQLCGAQVSVPPFEGLFLLGPLGDCSTGGLGEAQGPGVEEQLLQRPKQFKVRHWFRLPLAKVPDEQPVSLVGPVSSACQAITVSKEYVCLGLCNRNSREPWRGCLEAGKLGSEDLD